MRLLPYQRVFGSRTPKRWRQPSSRDSNEELTRRASNLLELTSPAFNHAPGLVEVKNDLAESGHFSEFIIGTVETLRKIMKTIIISLFVSFYFAAGSFAQADGPKPVVKAEKPAKEVAAKKPRPIPFNGPIVAVDKTAKTVTVGKNKLRVFYVTPETRINRDRVPATLEQLGQGERVGGSYRENASGKLELVTINVNTNPPGKEKKEKN